MMDLDRDGTLTVKELTEGVEKLMGDAKALTSLTSSMRSGRSIKFFETSTFNAQFYQNGISARCFNHGGTVHGRSLLKPCGTCKGRLLQ